MSPSGSIVVSRRQTFGVYVSDDCHVIQDVEVDGVSQGPIPSYTFTDVSLDHTIRATLRGLGPFTITASAGPAGSITPGGATAVACGGSRTYTITAPSGCGSIQDVKVDGVSQGPITSYTFADVRSNHTIEATVTAQSTYTITASVTFGRGTISPGGVTTVPCGSSQTYKFTPSTSCNVVGEVVVDGEANGGPIRSYTFADVRANHTVAVAFIPAYVYTISASANLGGTISPSGNVPVPCGEDRAFTIAATPNCGQIERVKVDQVWQGPITSFTFTDVRSNRSIQAVFSGGTYTVTATAGAGGSISPSGAISVECGAPRTYTIVPADDCHRIEDVKVDGVSQGPVSSYTFAEVRSRHSIEATFAALGPFTIDASATSGATITPPGATRVPCGGSQSYAIAISDACRVIADVRVDGASVGALTDYTFASVRADHTIAAASASSALDMAETHTGASWSGLSDGAIDLTVTGGAPPYEFAWSNGSISEDLAALAAGTYEVRVTDARAARAR